MKLQSCKGLALIFSILFGGFLLVYAHTVKAQQCRIVRIAKEMKGQESSIYLYPSELTVDKDTCVVWINSEPHEKVLINFDENSNACILSSDAPSGFMVLKGCFLTDFLDYGQTVSLRFKHAGVFSYNLEIEEKALNENKEKSRKIVRKGKIIVQ